jgi:hypothetical protein
MSAVAAWSRLIIPCEQAPCARGVARTWRRDLFLKETKNVCGLGPCYNHSTTYWKRKKTKKPKMRSVVIDAAALEEKQAAFFASKDASISTGLLVGRMTGAKDHIVSAVVLREFSLAARSCSKLMLL